MGAMTYAEFGEEFILHAATPERVIAAVKQIAGDEVLLGPIRAGPVGAASVVARVVIGEPIAEEVACDPLTYLVRLPVDVSLGVRIGATGRFDAHGEIALHLTVRTATPLAIVVDVQEVAASEVRFDVTAHGMHSKLLGRAGDVHRELQQRAADYVNGQIHRPDVIPFTRIDLIPFIDSVWPVE